MKTKTLKLSYGKISGDYKVVQITDSVEFHPGQYLKKDEIEALCARKDWKVTIVAA